MISEKVSKHLFLRGLEKEKSESDTSYYAFKFIQNKAFIKDNLEIKLINNMNKKEVNC